MILNKLNIITIRILFSILIIGNGRLFKKCPLIGEISKCLIFFKAGENYKIPCKALHPDIKVNNENNVIFYNLF